MEHGLCLVQISITNYRALTIIGWARRKGGDEWELVPGARIVTRKPGEYADWNGFDDLASSGPAKKYQLADAMLQPEPLHRLMVRRCKPADEKAWEKHCPMPKNWTAKGAS